jgi:hypothetical protein
VFYSTRSTLLLLLFAALAGGCGGDPKQSRVTQSGFLGDYSQLAPGRQGQARLIYINPEADFSLYDKILIDPVTIWDTERSAPMASPPPDQRRMAEHFEAALRRQLEQEFGLVDAAKPGTLRIRMAITRVEGTQVGIECEILDVTSGARLVGAVDERTTTPIGGGGEAKALGGAFDRWAGIIRMRLVAFRNFDAAQKAQDQPSEP